MFKYSHCIKMTYARHLCTNFTKICFQIRLHFATYPIVVTRPEFLPEMTEGQHEQRDISVTRPVF